MGTGTAIAEGDRVRSAKMNLKLETVDIGDIKAEVISVLRQDRGLSVLVDPASLAAQIAGKQVVGPDLVGTFIAVPSSTLEADLLYFSPLAASFSGVHTLAAIDGASKRWKTYAGSVAAVGAIPNSGLMGTIAVDPPSIAAQILWTTAVALPATLAFVGPDDLLITGGAQPGADLIQCPFYMSEANIRTSLHAVAAVDGAAVTYNVVVIVKPTTISVDINPPALAAQTALKITVTVPGVLLGDVIGVIPPNLLEADLIFLGAYASAANEVQVCVHSIAAVDGGPRTWRFVRFPGGLAV